MRVLIATDAWHAQINGVVTTLSRVGEELSNLDVDVTFVAPEQFRSVPLPGYRCIRRALARRAKISHFVVAACPAWIHIATEGPIG